MVSFMQHAAAPKVAGGALLATPGTLLQLFLPVQEQAKASHCLSLTYYMLT